LAHRIVIIRDKYARSVGRCVGIRTFASFSHSVIPLPHISHPNGRHPVMYEIHLMTFLVSQQYTPPNGDLCAVGTSVAGDARPLFMNPSGFIGGQTTWQCNGEDRALHPCGSPTVGNGQCSVMFGNDATSDKQAETTPAAIRTLVAADKWLENPLHVSLGDTSAIVADLYRGGVLVRADSHFDSTILYRVFDGIVHQIPYRLNDAVAVCV